MLAALTTRRAQGAALVGPDGERLDVPAEAFEILREVVEALAQGLAITIAPHQMVLSTSEAADILGVSRPTLVRLLEAGEIPFDQPGGTGGCAWRTCWPITSGPGGTGPPG